MELRIFTEPQQGATYDDLVAVAQEAERLGFGAFFRSDHYLGMGTDGLPGPSDAWITLAGIARETSTIRLGTMMTSATFRLPGPLAISVANVDQMSGGRVELGIGAGWFEQEHTAYGIPFPGTGERFDRFEEQLAIITGLWATEGGFSFDGEHYQVTDSPGPAQADPGRSRRSSSAASARSGRPSWRPATPTSSTCRSSTRRPRRPSSSGSARPARRRTATPPRCAGPTPWCSASAPTRPSSSAGRRRSGATRTSSARTAWPAPRRRSSTRSGGTPTLGAERLYLQVLDLADLDHLRLVARDVMPHV